MKSINDIMMWGEFEDEIKARLVLGVVESYKDNPDWTLEEVAWGELNQLCDYIYQSIEDGEIAEIVEEAKKYIEKE